MRLFWPGLSNRVGSISNAVPTIDRLCNGSARDLNHAGKTPMTDGLGESNSIRLTLVNCGRNAWSFSSRCWPLISNSWSDRCFSIVGKMLEFNTPFQVQAKDCRFTVFARPRIQESTRSSGQSLRVIWRKFRTSAAQRIEKTRR